MLTNGDFAAYAMRLARRSSEWAADSMTPKEFRNQPMRLEAVERFLKDQRDLLEWIEAEAHT